MKLTRRKLFAGLFASVAAIATGKATFSKFAPKGETITADDPRSMDLEVVDLASGKVLEMVAAVNVAEGWVERYMLAGHQLNPAPTGESFFGYIRRPTITFFMLVDGKDSLRTWRQFGSYELRKKQSVEKDPLRPRSLYRLYGTTGYDENVLSTPGNFNSNLQILSFMVFGEDTLKWCTGNYARTPIVHKDYMLPFRVICP